MPSNTLLYPFITFCNVVPCPSATSSSYLFPSPSDSSFLACFFCDPSSKVGHHCAKCFSDLITSSKLNHVPFLMSRKQDSFFPHTQFIFHFSLYYKSICDQDLMFLFHGAFPVHVQFQASKLQLSRHGLE